MIKWVVAIVLLAMLLTHGSPWAGPFVPLGSFDPGHLFEGLLGGLVALIALGIALFVVFSVLATVIGSAVLLVLGLPALIVLAVLAVVFLPILIPFLIVLAFLGLCLKGIGLVLAG